MSRVLLVAPAFHGYAHSVAGALERRGHPTTVHHYDALGTVRKKLRYELPDRCGSGRAGDRLATAVTTAALRRLDRERPEVVVVIRGDLLGDDFWSRLDELAAPRAVWLYDELERMSHPVERLVRIGPVASYSARDVTTLGALGADVRHLPLAYDPYAAPVARAPRHDGVVFVGARYPSRERLLLHLQAHGVPVVAYGKDWSRHPVDRIRTWGGRRPALPAGRDLSRADGYAVMAAASAALNVHERQDGFTMRTFEAAGVGGVELVDRTDVASLYEPGEEVLVFGDQAELVDLARRARTDRPWADRIRARATARTLAEHTMDHRVAELEAMWAR